MLSDTTEIGLREIQMLKIFRKKEGPMPGAQTPEKETDQPETGIVYANLKPRKKKQDIAKELGVSRTTCGAWRKWRGNRRSNEPGYISIDRKSFGRYAYNIRKNQKNKVERWRHEDSTD